MKLSIAVTALTIANTSTTTAAQRLRGRTLAEELEIQSKRELQTVVTGECTTANFADKTGGQAALAGLLGVSNDAATIQATLTTKCQAATEATVAFGEITYKGRQFDKSFFDGETTWNEQVENDGKYVLSQDAGRVKSVHDAAAATTVFEWPGSDYMTNFNNCAANAVTCCYVDARLDGATDPEDNSDVCVVELYAAPKTNHIQANGGAYTIFDANADDKTYCHGFVYSDDEDAFDNRVKATTLFEMAMYDGLYTKGYVRNVPGAPMCGCIEQMPIVSNAACVETKEGYSISADGDVSVYMTYGECEESSLSEKASAMAKTGEISEGTALRIKDRAGSGDCEKSTASFMNSKFLVKSA